MTMVSGLRTRSGGRIVMATYVRHGAARLQRLRAYQRRERVFACHAMALRLRPVAIVVALVAAVLVLTGCGLQQPQVLDSERATALACIERGGFPRTRVDLQNVYRVTCWESER